MRRVILTFYRFAALTTTSRRGWRSEIRCEEAVNLRVGDGGIEKAHKMFRSITAVRVECEQTVIFAAECIVETQHLFIIVFQNVEFTT